MKIFNEIPSDWRDLQNKVSIIFNEMNFTAEVEKVIKSARGVYEVDVVAVTNELSDMNLKIFAECKLWNSNIPQSQINSFRCVVEDCGANIGYFISKTGFQQGAYESSENTILRLVTFEEFMELNYDKWKENVLLKLRDKLERFVKYYYIIDCSSFTVESGKGFNSQEFQDKAIIILNSFGFILAQLSSLKEGKFNEFEEHFNLCFLQSLFNSTPQYVVLSERVIIIDTLRDYINLILYDNEALDEIYGIYDSFDKQINSIA